MRDGVFGKRMLLRKYVIEEETVNTGYLLQTPTHSIVSFTVHRRAMMISNSLVYRSLKRTLLLQDDLLFLPNQFIISQLEKKKKNNLLY